MYFTYTVMTSIGKSLIPEIHFCLFIAVVRKYDIEGAPFSPTPLRTLIKKKINPAALVTTDIRIWVRIIKKQQQKRHVAHNPPSALSVDVSRKIGPKNVKIFNPRGRNNAALTQISNSDWVTYLRKLRLKFYRFWSLSAALFHVKFSGR